MLSPLLITGPTTSLQLGSRTKADFHRASPRTWESRPSRRHRRHRSTRQRRQSRASTRRGWRM